MGINNRYELNLYSQFLNAEGLNSVHYQSESFFKEFRHWLKEYKKVLSQYAGYLQNLKINLSSEKVVEVGKGIKDSIVMYPEYQVISEYAETLGEDASKLIIEDGKPYALKENKKSSLNHISRLITFNPYFDDDISNWHLIHNGGMGISIGVCGKVYDRNSSAKIRMISDIADKMDNYYIENYDLIGDNYFYNVHSKKRIKFNKPR